LFDSGGLELRCAVPCFFSLEGDFCVLVKTLCPFDHVVVGDTFRWSPGGEQCLPHYAKARANDAHRRESYYASLLVYASRQRRLACGPLNERELVEIGSGLAAALDVALMAAIVCRDIKPATSF
jgi:hypothetical protein